jgi:hypothetical protein
VNDHGAVSLSNRPLNVRLPLLESEGIPPIIPQNRTYTMTDLYMHDLLRCHDAKLKYQPNSVRDQYDAKCQLAVLTMMRALVPHFCLDTYYNGPFRLTWTDLYLGNIFADDEYNIMGLPDVG